MPMTGVIAQDVQKVLPDAVSRSGPCTLSNGQAIDDVLIVDKDRIFIGSKVYQKSTKLSSVLTRNHVTDLNHLCLSEGLGAVHELSRMTDHLGNRVDSLEKANQTVEVKLTRLKRGVKGGHGGSTDSICSNSTNSSSSNEGAVKAKRLKSRLVAPSNQQGLFHNRCVQVSVLLGTRGHGKLRLSF